MKNRSRIEIIASILEVTSSEYEVTHARIMYNAFLSYKMLQSYLPFMLEKGLIVTEKKIKQKTPFFVSTDKGRRFLYLYRQIDETLSAATNRKSKISKYL